MVPSEDLLPVLRRHITGPMDVTLCEAIQSAAIIFCRESTICRTLISLSDVQPDHTMQPDSGSDQLNIIKILAVSIPGHSLSHDQYRITHNTITFSDAHPVAEILCVLAPKFRSEQIPEITVSHHADSLIHGALAELHIVPGKPWYSPDLSVYHKQRFTDGYRRAFQQMLAENPLSGWSSPVRKSVYY